MFNEIQYVYFEVWDLSRLELITKIVAHDNPVCSVAVGGEFFFTGSLNQIKV